MNSFDTFLTAISDGDLYMFRRNYSDDFVNKSYKHNSAEQGVIKIEYVPRNGYKNIRPIHLACDRGYTEIAKQLIISECDLEASTKIGNRPIHMAASRGHWEMVTLLLKQGCNIDAVNRRGRTALHLAAKYDHVKTAKFLLFCGANMEKKDSMSNTAFQLAGIYGNETTGTVIREWKRLMEMVNNKGYGRFEGLLRQSGFKKFYINNDVCIESVIKFIANAKKCTSLDVLINDLRFYHYIKRHQNDDWLMHADIEAINRIFYEDNALIYCLNNEDNCPYFCSLLIELILDMDRMEEILQKIHRIVSNLPNRNIIEIVTKRQRFVNIKIKALWNRIHLAVSDNRLDMIEYLLANNIVNVNSTDEIGNTPLFLACIHGHSDSARILLCYGADLYTTNKYNQNLLQVAIENGMHDFIKSNLDVYKPDNRVDSLGHSTLDVAIKFAPENLFEQILSKYECIDKEIANAGPLTYLSYNRKEDMLLTISQRENVASLCLKVKGLIYQSIIDKMSHHGLRILDENCNSLLHLAAWRLSFETCQGLIEKGVDVNLRNEQGNTPMHEAISAYHFDNSQNEESLLMIVRKLIEAGADVTIPNEQHQSPLQLALQYINERLIKEMTNKSLSIVLQRAELDKLLSEKYYALLADLVSKLNKEDASNLITDDFMDKCADELSEAELGVVVNRASIASQSSMLTKLLSSQVINHGKVVLLHCLLQNQNNLSSVITGETVLTHFLKKSDVGTCENLLLSKYASFFVSYSNQERQSPLHIAAEKGYLNLVDTILCHTDRYDDKDNEGNTPLGLLLQNCSTSDNKERISLIERAAKTIIREGADINSTNAEGCKAIDQCQDKKLKKRLSAFQKSCQSKSKETTNQPISVEIEPANSNTKPMP